MNILVIGNGFDLAHGLPTKYGDFLFFSKILLKMAQNADIESEIPKDYNTYEKWISKDKDNLAAKAFNIDLLDGDEWKIGKSDRDKNAYRGIVFFCKINFYDSKPNIVKNILYLIYDNIWIEYFLQCNMYQKENWIDFESEISKVIQSLDNDMHRLSGTYSIEDEIFDLSNKFLNQKYSDYTYTARSINDMKDGHLQKAVTYKEIRDKLLDDLNRLIRAFEIYSTAYVGNIEIQKKSPDIEKLEIDKVLSFNYTDTFSKLYKIAKDTEDDDIDSFDYIHGKANINNSIKTNNMVLGIDEYLSDDRKNKEVEFIAFKKYYQRIYKQTGCKYKNWLQEIQRKYSMALQNEANYMDMMKAAYNKKDQKDMWNWYMASMCNNLAKKEVHDLYIFGHSLDITDKDILRDLILNDNVKTTIFYPDKDTMGQQIANLVKVIEQDELIKRTGGSTKTIEFKQQQPMERIKQKDGSSGMIVDEKNLQPQCLC